MATQQLSYSTCHRFETVGSLLRAILVDFPKEGTNLLHIFVISRNMFICDPRCFLPTINKKHTHTHTKATHFSRIRFGHLKKGHQFFNFQVIQSVTFSSPIVGGHDSPLKRVTCSLTIPKGSRLESPGWCFFSKAIEGERKSPGDAEIEKLSSSDAYWAWREEAFDPGSSGC